MYFSEFLFKESCREYEVIEFYNPSYQWVKMCQGKKCYKNNYGIWCDVDNITFIINEAWITKARPRKTALRVFNRKHGIK